MLQKDGIAIDGVGMQAHYRLPAYTADKETFMQNFEDSVKAFTELGVNVQITELDISIYESSTSVSASDGLTTEDEYAQAEMYGKIFEICRKYSTPWKTGAGVVNCVTTWGIADDSSSLNSSSRKDYPLLFDRDHKPKRAYYEVSTF
jgi:endo-1,4-beta-xylanase